MIVLPGYQEEQVSEQTGVQQLHFQNYQTSDLDM